MSTPQKLIRISLVRVEDTAELAELLNAVILRGGSTAYEQVFTADQLASEMLTGPNVVHCVVARDECSASLCGFQTLYRSGTSPEGVVDIATYTRIGLARCGIGSALFTATSRFALDHGFLAINATIRADNAGGMAYYMRLGFSDYRVEPGVPLTTGERVDRVSKRFRLRADGYSDTENA